MAHDNVLKWVAEAFACLAVGGFAVVGALFAYAKVLERQESNKGLSSQNGSESNSPSDNNASRNSATSDTSHGGQAAMTGVAI